MSRPPLARSAAAGLALLAGGDPSGTAAEPVSPPAATVNAPTTPAIASGPTTSTGPALSRQSAPPVDAVPPSAQAVAPATEKSPPSSDPNTATENTWPKDFQVTIGLDIGTPSLPAKSYRPYIAFWVENASHQMVRTLGVLGNDSRFVNHLTTWRRAGGAAFALSFITRATRPNGVYSIAWDGRDDDGQPVPQGSYTICVELVREEAFGLVRQLALVARPLHQHRDQFDVLEPGRLDMLADGAVADQAQPQRRRSSTQRAQAMSWSSPLCGPMSCTASGNSNGPVLKGSVMQGEPSRVQKRLKMGSPV